MSVSFKLVCFTVLTAFAAGCTATGRLSADAECAVTTQGSPPSAATPTGPTAMNPPPGYPPLMNPTAPMQVGTMSSNIGYGGARTPPTEAQANTAARDCDRVLQIAR